MGVTKRKSKCANIEPPQCRISDNCTSPVSSPPEGTLRVNHNKFNGNHRWRVSSFVPLRGTGVSLRTLLQNVGRRKLNTPAQHVAGQKCRPDALARGWRRASRARERALWKDVGNSNSLPRDRRGGRNTCGASVRQEQRVSLSGRSGCCAPATVNSAAGGSLLLEDGPQQDQKTLAVVLCQPKVFGCAREVRVDP